MIIIKQPYIRRCTIIIGYMLYKNDFCVVKRGVPIILFMILFFFDILVSSKISKFTLKSKVSLVSNFDLS